MSVFTQRLCLCLCACVCVCQLQAALCLLLQPPAAGAGLRNCLLCDHSGQSRSLLGNTVNSCWTPQSITERRRNQLFDKRPLSIRCRRVSCAEDISLNLGVVFKMNPLKMNILSYYYYQICVQPLCAVLFIY